MFTKAFEKIAVSSGWVAKKMQNGMKKRMGQHAHLSAPIAKASVARHAAGDKKGARDVARVLGKVTKEHQREAALVKKVK